jgi:hypothetical protein
LADFRDVMGGAVAAALRDRINHSRLEQISEISDFVMRLQSWLDPEKRAVVFVRDDVQKAVGTLADVANPLVKIRQ